MLDRARIAVAALLGLGLELAPCAARADEYQDHVDRATALAQEEHYKDALVELDAAYALRQSPRLLYLIAQTKQRLGRVQEALAGYERFLAANDGAEPSSRADAKAQIAALRRILALPERERAPANEWGAEKPPVEVRWDKKPSPGLMAGGAVLFGAAYLGAVVTATIVHLPGHGNDQACQSGYGGSNTCPDGSIGAAAWTLLVPVAGPFVSSIVYHAPTWAVTWTLIDGAAQVGGVAMMAYAVKHPKNVPVYASKLLLLPYAGMGAAGLRAVGRF
jgi:hypothetical protein